MRVMELLTRSAHIYSGHLRPEVPLVGAGTSGLAGTAQPGHEHGRNRRKDTSRKYRSERPELPVEQETVPKNRILTRTRCTWRGWRICLRWDRLRTDTPNCEMVHDHSFLQIMQMKAKNEWFPINKEMSIKSNENPNNSNSSRRRVRWPRPPYMSVMIWHREGISWVQTTTHHLSSHINIWYNENEIFNVGIMGGGIAQ